MCRADSLAGCSTLQVNVRNLHQFTLKYESDVTGKEHQNATSVRVFQNNT